MARKRKRSRNSGRHSPTQYNPVGNDLYRRGPSTTANPYAWVQSEGTTPWIDGSIGRLIKSYNTLEHDANVATISPYIETVIKRRIQHTSADKATLTTEIESLADYVCYMAKFVGELTLQKTQQHIIKTLTRSDTTPGQTLTPGGMNGLLSGIQGEGGLPVPILSLHLISPLMKVFQLSESIEYKSEWARYFMQASPDMDLADLEALALTAQGELDGISAATLYNIGTVPFTVDLCRPQPPVPMLSDLGLFVSYCLPVEDDAAEQGDAFGANGYIVWHPSWGVPDFQALCVLYRKSTGTLKFIDTPAGAANKFNIGHAAFGASSFTDFADTATQLFFLYNTSVFLGSANYWMFMQTGRETYTYGAAEADWNNKFVVWLTDRCNTPGLAVKTWHPLLKDIPSTSRGAAIASETMRSIMPGDDNYVFEDLSDKISDALDEGEFGTKNNRQKIDQMFINKAANQGLDPKIASLVNTVSKVHPVSNLARIVTAKYIW
jgi:hypothetical protein